jgi:hypothetical protein
LELNDTPSPSNGIRKTLKEQQPRKLAVLASLEVERAPASAVAFELATVIHGIVV